MNMKYWWNEADRESQVLKGKPALVLILPSKSDTGWPGINSFKTHSFCEKFSEASG